MKAVHSPRSPRALHPGAWWLWALAVAAAASRTTNPILLGLLAAVVLLVVLARRTGEDGAASFGLFIRIALIVIALRVLLQAVLSVNAQGSHLLVQLPRIGLPDWVGGVKLGGRVTWEALLSALYHGGQLAVMLLAIGAANALASPRRMLRSLPGALYEMQVACVVALTFAPQLVADARRIRAARRLRGHRTTLASMVRTTALPVLEGGLDRAIDLAASMDARGFGRVRTADRRTARLVGGAALLALVAVLVGSYAALTNSMPGYGSAIILAASCALLILSLLVGRRELARSRYRPDPWALPEWLVTGCGLVAAVTMVIASGITGDRLGLQTTGLDTPQLPPVPVLAILVAALPAVLAPDPIRPPRTSAAADAAPVGGPPILTEQGKPATRRSPRREVIR